MSFETLFGRVSTDPTSRGEGRALWRFFLLWKKFPVSSSIRPIDGYSWPHTCIIYFIGFDWYSSCLLSLTLISFHISLALRTAVCDLAREKLRISFTTIEPVSQWMADDWCWLTFSSFFNSLSRQWSSHASQPVCSVRGGLEINEISAQSLPIPLMIISAGAKCLLINFGHSSSSPMGSYSTLVWLLNLVHTTATTAHGEWLRTTTRENEEW